MTAKKRISNKETLDNFRLSMKYIAPAVAAQLCPWKMSADGSVLVLELFNGIHACANQAIKNICNNKAESKRKSQ